jgi:tetratricopeptide (TPR) repeat protein
LAVVFLAVYGFWSWRGHRALEGQAALASLQEIYDAPISAPAESATPETLTYPSADDKYRALVARADEVLEDHGSTEGGRMALYYRGLARFELEEGAEARADLEEFLRENPRHFLADLVRRKLAALDEREGNLERACSTYRELSLAPTTELPQELALLDLARCLSLSGSLEESRATYQRVVDEFPESLYAGEARESLQALDEG